MFVRDCAVKKRFVVALQHAGVSVARLEVWVGQNIADIRNLTRTTSNPHVFDIRVYHPRQSRLIEAFVNSRSMNLEELPNVTSEYARKSRDLVEFARCGSAQSNVLTYT